ncbi:MAG: ribosomal protein S12 methylthiotransferase [Limisphaerales bacterium]|jgi:ribosomal protein S12 methylthiotransferase
MRTKGKDRVNIITLGCSKNLVDSEVMLHQLQTGGVDAVHQEAEDDANVIIVNTCGFIDRAKEESIQTILRYADARNDGAIDKLYVTGCLSERYKKDLSKEIPEVDAWFGTLDLPSLLKRFDTDYRHELVGERMPVTPSHYAYLKISEGCNRKCSFCAIPLMRGGHVSRPIEELVKEAKYLAAQGVREIMLIAQELTYYGLDIYKARRLADLLRELDKVEGIDWIRLHYAYPSKFPMDIIDAIAECDSVCNYLDMPLQHASNSMLDAMKRQITREETTELIKAIRVKIPDITLRTTMLVGFPGETEEDFEELKDFAEEMCFDRLGVFQYSHEEGTSGYDLTDDVPAELKEQRAAELMEVQERISFDINEKLAGQEMMMLVDRKEGSYFVGRTHRDSPEVDNEVLVDAEAHFLRIGDFVKVRIDRTDSFDLYATPV